MNKNLLSFGLLAPLAAASLAVGNMLPAQAASGLSSDTGTTTLDSKVNFFSGQPGTSNPGEFWFPKSAGCAAAVGFGINCDFNPATVTGLFDYINLPAQTFQNNYQYLLANRNDLTPNAGGLLPSLGLDSSAFNVSLNPNNFAPDFLTDPTQPTGAAVPTGNGGEFLAFRLLPNAASPAFLANIGGSGQDGIGFLQLKTDDPTDPFINVYLTQVNSFFSSFDPLGQTAQTTVSANVFATAFNPADGTETLLNGGSSFQAAFSFTDTQAAGNLTVNLKVIPPVVPEPTSILGLAFAVSAGALSLRKKKEIN